MNAHCTERTNICCCPAVAAEVKTGKPAAYIIDVLVNCAEGTVVDQGPRQQPKLSPPTEPGVPLVVAFPLEQAHPPPPTLLPYICRCTGLSSTCVHNRRVCSDGEKKA